MDCLFYASKYLGYKIVSWYSTKDAYKFYLAYLKLIVDKVGKDKVDFYTEPIFLESGTFLLEFVVTFSEFSGAWNHVASDIGPPILENKSSAPQTRLALPRFPERSKARTKSLRLP